jgi:hypothetical protein
MGLHAPQPQLHFKGVQVDNRLVILRPALALFLAACSFEATAQAVASATGLPPCVKTVRFNAAWFADPELDNSKSAAELTKMGSAPGSPASSALQLGHVVVGTKLSVVPQTTCQGVVVQLEYVKPVLRVASEFQPGTCAYARVMNHEQTHVRIHRDIARQFRELDFPWTTGSSSAAILAFAKQELDRLRRAQELFDSPEEYARNHTLCGGELSRLVKLPPPVLPPAVPPKEAAKQVEKEAEKPVPKAG